MCLVKQYERVMEIYIDRNFEKVDEEWFNQQKKYLAMYRSQCGCCLCKK